MWSSSQTKSKSRPVGTTSYYGARPTSATQSSLKSSNPLIIHSYQQQTQRTQLRNTDTVGETIDQQTKSYIANLQGQIHLLELESKILKERLSSGEGDRKGGILDLDGVDSTDVDPTIRELRKMYLKLEQESKDEKEVCNITFI